MQKKEIEKIYIEKINQLKKHDEAYFEHNKPAISDADYDNIKKQVLYVCVYKMPKKCL